MVYQGSKSRISKYIVTIIQKYIDKNNIDTYIEPFVGGANVIDKIKCKTKIGTDLNKYVIALLNHVKNDLPLYEEVSKELYDQIKLSLNSNDDSFEDWKIGNIGILSSYNGKWFGGYAHPVYEKTKNGLRYRNYYNEKKNNLLKQAKNLKDCTFETKDYRWINDNNLNNCLIYCDPPYKDTTSYYNANGFDYKEFWQIMRDCSKNNIVIISELDAPDDFECIWKKDVSRSINTPDKKKAVEKLFIYRN